MRTPSGKPELMSVVSSMDSFLKKVDKSQEFAPITEIFDYVLGIESRSTVVWAYLNKGVHEEQNKPEPDQLIVKEIVQKLAQLDSIAKSKKKTTGNIG
jgi:hypothetical protein